jgi:hypothetical protein
MCTIGLGDHEQPGRILVDPVHDARPGHAANAGQPPRRNGAEAR